MTVRQCDNQVAINQGRGVRQHNQPAVWLAGEFIDSMFDVVGTGNRYNCRLDRERWCGGFDQARIVGAAAGRQFRIEYECDALDAGRDFFEQLQPFACQRGLNVRKSGCITARACQAFDEALPDGVGDHSENYWDRAGLPQERRGYRGAPGQDHVGFERNKLSCKSLHPFRIARCPTKVDLQIVVVPPS